MVEKLETNYIPVRNWAYRLAQFLNFKFSVLEKCGLKLHIPKNQEKF